MASHCDHAGRSPTRPAITLAVPPRRVDSIGVGSGLTLSHSDMNLRRTADQENLAVDLRPSAGSDTELQGTRIQKSYRRLALTTDRPTGGGRPDSDGQVLPGRRTKKAAKKPISGWAGARNHGGAPAPARQLLSLRLQGLIASCSHRDRMTPRSPALPCALPSRRKCGEFTGESLMSGLMAGDNRFLGRFRRD